ncbi:unnamed protein product [Agarophyton chilense]|eukprot:gb/GEZJ01004535.1/.p1 GENE.gb/GEZJ01004535.1/~~gb/GEZJ01004535.1/.p1  ORF type:complete len:190 (-),score=17.25 gb/GEZJ01004535.1/:466-1035(-)
MVFARQLRFAFISLNDRLPKVLPQPLISNRVTRFKILPAKRLHSRSVFLVHCAVTDQLLYKIVRASSGFRLLNALNKPMYYATRDRHTKEVRIRDSNSDVVLFTTQQKGQFFSIIDVFCGEACDGEPYSQICGALDYELTENVGGRTLASVQRVVRSDQPSTCSVKLDAGLNAAVFLLLITTVNEVSLV